MINNYNEQSGFSNSIKFQNTAQRYRGEIKLILQEIYNYAYNTLKERQRNSNQKIQPIENSIRDAIFLFLDRTITLQNGDILVFASEQAVPPDNLEQSRRRPDLRVHYIPTNSDRILDSKPYYLECKRLDGKPELNRKYLYYDQNERGLHRFIDDSEHKEAYYPVHNGVTAMLGFIVKSIDISENVNQINKLIPTIPEINNAQLQDKQLLRQEIFIDACVDTYISEHQTITRKTSVTIYHLFLDVANMLQPKQANQKKFIKGA